MIRLFTLICFSIMLCSCSVFGRKDYDQQLKSPCVSANGGPCKHIPINIIWQNYNNKQYSSLI